MDSGGFLDPGIGIRQTRVESMKPMLKAPGAKRLKLRYDELLSSFAFIFNLRRYTMAMMMDLADEVAGRCRLAR